MFSILIRLTLMLQIYDINKHKFSFYIVIKYFLRYQINVSL